MLKPGKREKMAKKSTLKERMALEQKGMVVFRKKKHLPAPVIGFILGDMFGVPYEFQKKPQPAKEFTGYGTHYQPPYTWSDDSAFLLATYFNLDKSIAELQHEYLGVLQGRYFQYGECFDVGNATVRGLKGNPVPAERGGGNGFIGRCIPYALQARFNEDAILENIKLTHSCEINIAAGMWYLKTLHTLVTEKNIPEKLLPAYEQKFSDSGGHLFHHTYTAIGAVYNALKTFDSATSLTGGFYIICRQGNDTDSVCALFGALWGAVNKIPRGLSKRVTVEVKALMGS